MKALRFRNLDLSCNADLPKWYTFANKSEETEWRSSNSNCTATLPSSP